MAEGAVTFFLQKLCEILEHEIRDHVGAAKEVRFLRDKLMMLQAFLKDADSKCKESARVKTWVSQIRDVTFDAEDIIDEFISECQQRHLRTSSGFLSSATEFLGKRSSLHGVSQGIKNINERLDRITATRIELGIDSLPDGREAPSTRRMRVPIVEEIDVVGIEDEANIIANKLLEGGLPRSVVSVYGMGGLGKTTLAKKVYNRTTISRNFQCMAWITVSQEYSVRQLMYDIIHHIMAIQEMEKKSDEELSGIVHGYLTGKKYLVVIDDIWSIEAWNDLEKSLPDDKNGSRILLTTRKRDVASETDRRSEPHLLRFLSENESWDLFCKKAFPVDTDHNCPTDLESVGKEVVGKCGGLPLAVVVLGGLLSKKEKTFREWNKVLQSIGWQLHESEIRISPILSLSYHDLPHYLKSCFLHVCAFPEDTAIPATKLMRIWVAEGLLEKRGDETMEDVAEDYLLELIDRSMIQVAQKTCNRVKTCRIHDLLRDLGIKFAEEDRFLSVYGNVDAEHASATASRRLAITHHDIGKYIFLNRETRRLSSLYCFTQYKESLEKKQWECLSRRFKLLRVLHIEGINVSFLPDEIGHLIHLRYLVITSYVGELERLPSTFSNLYNLQTLRIRGSDGIQIHDDMWKMKELRHLRGGRGILPQMAKHRQLDQLTNLQTLSMFVAGEWTDNELSKLTGLRKLGVRVESNAYKGLYNSISKLTNLEALRLVLLNDDYLNICELSHLKSLERMFLEGRLEKLPAVQDFPLSLTKITLWGSQLQQDPFAILGRLPNLQIIRLSNCYEGKKMTCSSQSFPKLVSLDIRFITTLEEWTVEEGAMPNLRNLGIGYFRTLKMIPEGLVHVTSLNRLYVYGMPIDFVKRIEPEGEDWYKIQHVPVITIE